MNRLSTVGKLVAPVILIGILAAGWIAGKRGMADVVAQDPRFEIDRWRSGKTVPDAAQFNSIKAELYKALDLDPGNPNLLEDLGRFHAARVERGRPSDSDVRAARRQALANFRQILISHPTSGYAGINVALMKYQLGELDEEYLKSLQLALRRAPWQAQVQLLAIELGLASWQGLPESMHQSLRQSIHDQAQWKLVNQKVQLQALLKRYRRPDLECLLSAAPSVCGFS